MIIENKTNLTNELVHQILEKQLPEYKYELINEIVVATLEDELKDDLQLNIITHNDEIELIEAIPFRIKLTIAICLLVIAYVLLSLTDWFVGFKILLYIFAFLLGGSLSDVFHGYRFKATYKPMKDQIRKTIKSSMKPKKR